MESLLGIIFIFSMFYAIFKVFGRRKVSLEDDSELKPVPCQTNRNFTIDDISDQLDTVNDVMEQIKNVEELITDIEVCEPGIHSKMFTLTWMSESGKNLSFQFWVHGGENYNTDLMRNLAYAERKNLRSLLKKEIRNLGERSYANVTETMTKHDSRGVVYND